MSDEIKSILELMYEDYKVYKGTDRVQEDDWLGFVVEAYFFLDYLSVGRFKKLLLSGKDIEKSTLAIIGIVDLDYDFEVRKTLANENLGISSESVKSHSVTYTTTREMVEEWKKEAHREKVDLSRKYLQDTNIFHRGL